MANITRNNHYVPQATLKRWSHDGERVWAYRLLASHHGVRQWRSELIARLTRQTDLYTEHRSGRDGDAFETFITRDFEEADGITRARNSSCPFRPAWRSIPRSASATMVPSASIQRRRASSNSYSLNAPTADRGASGAAARGLGLEERSSGCATAAACAVAAHRRSGTSESAATLRRLRAWGAPLRTWAAHEPSEDCAEDGRSRPLRPAAPAVAEFRLRPSGVSSDSRTETPRHQAIPTMTKYQNSGLLDPHS